MLADALAVDPVVNQDLVLGADDLFGAWLLDADAEIFAGQIVDVTRRAVVLLARLPRDALAGERAPHLVRLAFLLLAPAHAVRLVVDRPRWAGIRHANDVAADLVAARTGRNAVASTGVEIGLRRTLQTAARRANLGAVGPPAAEIGQLRTVERTTHRSLAFGDQIAVDAGKGQLVAAVVLDPKIDRAQIGGTHHIERDRIAMAIQEWRPSAVNQNVLAFVDRAVGFDLDGENAVVASGAIRAGATVRFDLPRTGDRLAGRDRVPAAAEQETDHAEQAAAGRAAHDGATIGRPGEIREKASKRFASTGSAPSRLGNCAALNEPSGYCVSGNATVPPL